MDLNEISIFLKVVQAGSFKSAAKQLGMPNSTVSAKISSLEKRLGTTLIQRTTRKLNVTQIGQNFYQKCSEGIESIKNAESLVTEAQNEAIGTLRVTAPVQLGAAFFVKFSTELLRKNPKLKVDYFLSDDALDLIQNNVDIAIRIGHLKDSSLIAKKIGDAYFSFYTSANYLKKNKAPQKPQELTKHSCLHFNQLGDSQWILSSTKGNLRLKVEAQITSNDLHLLKKLTEEGAGISLLPSFLCSEELKKKSLIRVLPDWKSNIKPVHFVYPSQKYISPKLRAFINEAEGPLKKLLNGN